MRPSTLAFVGLVFSASVGSSACDIKTGGDGGFDIGISRGSAEDTWTRSYPLSAGGRLEVINVNGRIDVSPSTDGSVEVAAHRSAKATSDDAAKELLGRIEIREEVSDARVRIESRPPKFSGLSAHEVKWTIRVPKGVHVDLRTLNGGIRLTGLDGSVHAETINGGVTGIDLASAVIEASSVNGGIDIKVGTALGADGRVDAETVNGGVTFTLPADSKATISARAVNGGVRVTELDVRKTGDEDSRRRLEGTLNGGGARVSLQTTHGGVRILSSSTVKPTN